MPEAGWNYGPRPNSKMRVPSSGDAAHAQRFQNPSFTGGQGNPTIQALMGTPPIPMPAHKYSAYGGLVPHDGKELTEASKISPRRPHSPHRMVASPVPPRGRDEAKAEADSLRRIQALQALEEQRRLEEMETRIAMLETRRASGAPQDKQDKPASRRTSIVSMKESQPLPSKAMSIPAPQSVNNNEELVRLLEAMQRELAQIRDDQEALRSHSAMVQGEQGDMINILKEECRDLHSDVQLATQENVALKKGMLEKDAQYSELKDQCRALHSEHRGLEGQHAAVKDECRNLRSDLSELEANLNRIKEQNRSLASEVAEVDGLRRECRGLRSDLSTLEDKLGVLKEQGQATASRLAENDARELRSSVVGLRDKVDDLDRDLQESHSSLLKGNDEAKGQIALLRTETGQLRDDVAVLNDKGELVNKRVKAVEGVCGELRAADKQGTLSEDVAVLRGAVKDVKAGQDQLTNDFCDLRQAAEESTDDLRRLRDNCSDLHSEHVSLADEHAQLTEECRGLHSEHLELSDNFDNLKDQSRQLHSDHMELRDEHENLKEDCRNLHSEIQAMERDVDLLRAHADKFPDQTREMMSANEKEMAALREKIEDTEQNLLKQLGQLAEILRRNDGGPAMSARADMERKLADQQNKSENLSAQLDASLTGLSATNTALQRLNDRLNYVDEALDGLRNDRNHRGPKVPPQQPVLQSQPTNLRSISPPRGHQNSSLNGPPITSVMSTPQGNHQLSMENSRVRELERRLGLPGYSL